MSGTGTPAPGPAQAAAWTTTAPELHLDLACGPHRHQLVWRQGELLLNHHPDLAAERALVALGGPQPTCLARLQLWQEAVADGGFLAEWVDEAHLSDARLSWLGMALERLRLEGFHEFLRHLPPGRAERMGQFLHRFPRPWLDRAACAVSAAVVDGEGVRCGLAPELVAQAAAHRLRRSFVDSIGGRLTSWGAAALVPLAITVSPDGAPSVEGTVTGPGRAVALTVGRGWLHRVWGAGAAVVDGHLVLALDQEPDGEFRA
ncbi:MAG: hypothetical protein OEY70_16330, partial [Acidimicrobiia bacterium]|nr:hypothetical protein [Acidimicrobiia bacterium]